MKQGGQLLTQEEFRSGPPSETFNNKETARALDDGVSQLPEPYRSVSVRRELEESSTKDVSARLDLE